MKCTCLIPFFNEYDRILNVLDEVVKIKAIDEIICVDDGSRDGTAELVKKHYPKIKILSNPKNLGKTEAVKVGLQHAKGDYILLLDADLRYIIAAEFENAIIAIQNNRLIDMIVLRRIHAPWIIKFTRGDILTTGERIVKISDLQIVLKSKMKGYQLEYAINKYMFNKKKNVYWMPSSAQNTFKFDKNGFLKGWLATIAVTIDIMVYIGIKDYLKHVLFFCRKEMV